MSSHPIRDLRSSITLLRDTFEELLPSPPDPTGDCRATRDDSELPTLGGWLHPTTNLGSYSHMLIVAELDNLGAIAAVLEPPAETAIFSIWPSARAALEAGSIAAYFLDPSASAKERMRRCLNWRMQGSKELRRFHRGIQDDPVALKSALADLDKFDQAFLDLATELEARPGKSNGAARLGEEFPSIMKLVDRALGNRMEPGLPHASYRQLSAVTHSGFHGFLSMLRSDGTPGHLPGTTRNSVELSPSRLAQAVLPAIVIAADTLVAFLDHIGADSERMHAASHRTLLVFARVAGSSATGAPETLDA